MASQYEKRKAKAEEIVKHEIETKRAEIRETAHKAQEPVYTHTGYDIFSPDGGKTFKVVEFVYNPTTGDAKVGELFDVSRLIALSYETKKTALGILKKKRYK